MDGTGRRAVARARRPAHRVVRAGLALLAGLVVVATALTVVVGATAGTAFAADPPSVTGLTVAQLEPVLRGWSPNVVISYVPALDQLPAGVDPTRVVAQGLRLLPPPFTTAAAAPPRVEVGLGALVPDLTGRTADEAAAVLAPLGLTADALPVGAPVGSVVSSQRPLPATVVGFGRVVALRLVPGPAATPTATPPAGGGRRPILVAAVATGSGLGLAALALVLVTGVRRRARRRRPSAGPPRVELHGHAGAAVDPVIVELGPSRSVRLEPHHDPGSTAVVLLEVRP